MITLAAVKLICLTLILCTCVMGFSLTMVASAIRNLKTKVVIHISEDQELTYGDEE